MFRNRLIGEKTIFCAILYRACNQRSITPKEQEMLSHKIVIRILLSVVAGIFLPILFFKFTGAEESIFIFQTVGLEAAGRYATGFSVWVAFVLLLCPSQYSGRAVISILITVPAFILLLTVPEVVLNDDGGLLFPLTCSVLTGSAAFLILGHKFQKERIV